MRMFRSLVLALAFFWFYTVTDGVTTYTRVWQPFPGGGGYWEPYDVGIYMPGITRLGTTWAG